ncbi:MULTISPECIES: hypothetical protein [Latilactobacillus]|uniref:hypothetical protein n=1 Tax=Latilactobacillus TaxID=2767885 RepID=UPI000C1275FC|nr:MULTISPECIES: hypothetical protein [Latilactobacillus]MDG2976879.1 hypothetical protein [Latilactobacillus curvatus]SON72833.1 conserved protein of unknown function [Latilactobacillus sakei]
MDNKSENKLHGKDYAWLAIEAGIASIPTVGSALQTAYFGAKNEKRFKRIENFYKELSEDVEKLKNQLTNPDEISQYSDEISQYMEKMNEIIESNTTLAKRSMLHNGFLNILKSPSKINWDQEQYFTSIIPQIDLTDLQLLLATRKLERDKWAMISDVVNAFEGKLDKFYLIGLCERLTNLGLFEKRYGDINMGSDGTIIETYYRITNLGKDFLSFTMDPPTPSS